MAYRLMFSVLLAMVSSVTLGQNPNEPVGPVKPVVVEGTVSAILDEPIQVQGAVSSTENRAVFRYKAFLPIPAGSPSGSTVRECFDVPVDRWLVIEQFHSSLLSETSPESSFVNLSVEVDASAIAIGTGFSTRFQLEPVGDRQIVGLPGTFFSMAQQVKLYSSPGSSVCMFLARGLDGTLGEETGSVSLFGILTDQP